MRINETAGSIYKDDLNKFKSRNFKGPEDSSAIFNSITEELNINFNLLDLDGTRGMFPRSFKLNKSDEIPKPTCKVTKLAHSIKIRPSAE